jgi:hypothetical protein
MTLGVLTIYLPNVHTFLLLSDIDFSSISVFKMVKYLKLRYRGLKIFQKSNFYYYVHENRIYEIFLCCRQYHNPVFVAVMQKS